MVEFEFRQVKVFSWPPLPPYPPQAKSLRIQGVVKVRMLVGTDGVPVSADASEGHPLLRRTAEAYALQMRFQPQLQDGVLVSARFTLTMPFTLH